MCFGKTQHVVVQPNPLHNGSYCHHDYVIRRFVSFHRHRAAAIVFGDDERFHVCHIDCLSPELVIQGPEISPEF